MTLLREMNEIRYQDRVFRFRVVSQPAWVGSICEAIACNISRSRNMGKWFSNLDKMHTLRDGWNGYSAPAPSDRAVDLARSFLTVLTENSREPSRVAPSAVGGVGITHKRRGRRVYVEFMNDGAVYALFSDKDSELKSEKVKPFPARFKELTKRIGAYLDE
jgi:hypothetical protein